MNPVLLCLVAAGAASLAGMGFVGEAPNRLVSGMPLMLWQAVSLPMGAGVGCLGAALLVASFLPQRRFLHTAVIAASAALLLLVLAAAGQSASGLAAVSPRAARTSLGAGFWIVAFCAVLAMIDALQRLKAGPAARLILAAIMFAFVAALALGGTFDALSIWREYAIRREAFLGELVRHCLLVLGALAPALAVGVPLGLWAARRRQIEAPLFATLNFVQTVPSIALFGLMIAPLSALGLAGIGVLPAIIALTLYALLPVVRNMHAGILGIDRAVIETASGMGMTAGQIFWRVELPLGMPVFLAGLRIVLVQAIGLACIAALIGAGGFGSFIFQGIGQYAVDLVLLGALPVIFLALAADFILSLLIALAPGSKA
jgi:osmoprotectant transport system permease protein